MVLAATNTALTIYGIFALIGLLLVIGAFVSALRTPAWVWNEADSSKSMWILILIVSVVLGLGVFGAVIYFFFPQPKLRRMKHQGPPMGFPGR